MSATRNGGLSWLFVVGLGLGTAGICVLRWLYNGGTP